MANVFTDEDLNQMRKLLALRKDDDEYVPLFSLESSVLMRFDLGLAGG